MPRTKIVCTIGPASASAPVMRKMMLAGMDVIRLNFSHGTHPEHRQRIRLVRMLNKKYRRHIRVLQDLEGYRIRIGGFKGRKEILLKKRQSVVFLPQQESSDENVIPFDYQGDLKAIKPKSAIFIDDGTIALTVKKSTSRSLEAHVVVPGTLKEHKGVNIPDVSLQFHGLTEKDQKDLLFGIDMRVDYVAQSFVRDASDVLLIRDFLGKRHASCRIIAKIENRQGIENIDAIIQVADGIMIARGDMGVSIPIYEIPIVQKRIIKKCNRAGKPVITATQMLESMTEHTRPTRAEVTDVANAIIDGSDFLMLSGETAAGHYPVEAVRMMNDIIAFTEKATECVRTRVVA